MTPAFILFNIATQRVHAVLWRRDQLARWRTSNTLLISETEIDLDAIAVAGLQAIPKPALFEGLTRYACRT